MSRSSKPPRLDFLGPEVIRLMIFGALAGVSVFIIETTIAFGIQAFLLALELMKDDVVRLPSWVPSGSLQSVLIFITALAAFRSILYYFQVYVPNATYNAFGFRQRKRLMEWAFSKATVNTPYVATLYTERVTFSSSLINGVQYIVIYGCTSILITGALIYLSPVLSLISFVLMAIFLIPIYFLNTKIKAASHRFSESWESANNRLLVGLKNIFLIRIYGAEKEEVRKSQDSLEIYSKSHSLIYKLGALKFALPQFVGVLIICLTVYAGKNYFSVESGVLISFLYLFFRWVQNLSFIYLNAGQVVHYRPQIDALYDWYLNHYKDFQQNQEDEKLKPDQTGAHFETAIGWSAKNLSYQYSDREPVIAALNFQIQPGSVVSIKGPSGSGKSTLIGLLLAQLQGRGDIQVIDQKLGSMTVEQAKPYLLNSIGYAGPEPFIIEGTVKENLLFANHRQISEPEISEILRLTDCQFVLELPGQLNFKITEQGQGLSTGQKQRLSLTRALLRNPKAIFLDEALSNVDQRTRDTIIKNLCSQKEKMTLIFISHFETESLTPDIQIIFDGQGQITVKK